MLQLVPSVYIVASFLLYGPMYSPCVPCLNCLFVFVVVFVVVFVGGGHFVLVLHLEYLLHHRIEAALGHSHEVF